MRCPSCQAESSHIRIETNGRMGCPNCMGFSETSGSPTDKILTRNSARVTEQQTQYEQDMITPYIVDKSTNKAVVNEEFINLYPEQAAQTYTQEELKSVGQADLKPASVEDEDSGSIEFKGNTKQSISEIIEEI